MATDLDFRMKEGTSKLVCSLIDVATKCVYTNKACEHDLKAAQSARFADGSVNLTEMPDIAEVITSLAEAGFHKHEQDKVGLSSMFEIGKAMLAMIVHVNDQVDTKVDTPFPAYLRDHPEFFIGIELPVLGILTKLVAHEKMFEGCDQAYHYMCAKLKDNSACLVGVLPMPD